MILGVSRRTDIPNYYSDCFFNRLKEGFLCVRNPMNLHQDSKISMQSRNKPRCTKENAILAQFMLYISASKLYSKYWMVFRTENCTKTFNYIKSSTFSKWKVKRHY
nr:DUF1848 family protein [uncultured Lachnoclostridium sp.]